MTTEGSPHPARKQPGAKRSGGVARLEKDRSYLCELLDGDDGTPIFTTMDQLIRHAEWQEHADMVQLARKDADAAEERSGKRPSPRISDGQLSPAGLKVKPDDSAASWQLCCTPSVLQLFTANKESLIVIPRCAITHIEVKDTDTVEDLKLSVLSEANLIHRVLNSLASCIFKRTPCYSKTCCMPRVRQQKVRTQLKSSEIKVYAGGAEARTFFILDRDLVCLHKLLQNPMGV